MHSEIEDIVLDEMKKLGVLWAKDTISWHKVFQGSLKKFFFFQEADEKWTYFVFYQPHNIWPKESLNASEFYLLRLAKVVSHLNPRQVYVDKKSGIDPEAFEAIVGPEETAKGLQLWAKAFKAKILPKMIKSYEKVLERGAKRIMEVCPQVYGKPCKSLLSAKRIFHNTATEKLAPQRQILFPGYPYFIASPIVELFWHFYRV